MQVNHYAVIENAGTDNETIVAEFPRYMDAIAFARLNYTDDEADLFDIMKYMPGGQLTTEF